MVNALHHKYVAVQVEQLVYAILKLNHLQIGVKKEENVFPLVERQAVQMPSVNQNHVQLVSPTLQTISALIVVLLHQRFNLVPS
jgi:hypothetical protein